MIVRHKPVNWSDAYVFVCQLCPLDFVDKDIGAREKRPQEKGLNAQRSVEFEEEDLSHGRLEAT